MYRFALRPRWIASHLLVVLALVIFANLGLWQLRRHDERADRNATVAARAELPAEPVAGLVAGAASDDGAGDGVEALRFRAATASGTYTEGADLLVDNRSLDGLPGSWVLTPLRLDDGGTVMVNRGFLGFVGGELAVPEVPAGRVEVAGTLVPWASETCGVRRDDPEGPVVGAACLSLDAAESAAGGAVLPIVLQRVRQVPVADASLVAVPLPELDSGPHRSYAAQWFIFGVITAVVYGLILRRTARSAGPPDDGDEPGPGHPPETDDDTATSHPEVVGG